MENTKKSGANGFFKNTIFRGTLALVCVALGCGLLIALVNMVTSPIIAKAIEDKKIAQLDSLFDGEFKPTPVEITEFSSDDAFKIMSHEYDEIKVDDTIIGYVFYGTDKNQYGTIDLIVAFDPTGKVIGVKGVSIEQTAGRDKNVEKMLIDYNGVMASNVGAVKQSVTGATRGFDTVQKIVKNIANTAIGLNIFEEVNNE